MALAFEFVMGKVMLDKLFRQQLLLNPKMTLQSIGLNLTGEEINDVITKIKNFDFSDKIEALEGPSSYWGGG